MREGAAEAVVAGHICVDVLPVMEQKKEGMDGLLVPGKLVEIGPAIIAAGGAVSNTGIALHRLGVRARLMGKIGDDWFGGAIKQSLEQYGEGLSTGLIVSQGEHSSYTIVISPPKVDRIFLHCTGANDTFAAHDIQAEALEGARLFHFGYPPLMRNMYADGGQELSSVLSLARKKGLTVSLDLARPDPESEAGRADWRLILSRAMPNVDLFLPSFEEILYMLRRSVYDKLLQEHGADGLLSAADGDLLSGLADELLGMGAAVAAIKLGEYGLYVKTASDVERLKSMGLCSPKPEVLSSWTGKELLVPTFEVEVVGTTGAGDCTIAGFLTGLLRGLPLEQALRGAAGVGACNVECADAASGIPAWEDVLQRISAGWPARTTSLRLEGWKWSQRHSIWYKGRMET